MTLARSILALCFFVLVGGNALGQVEQAPPSDSLPGSPSSGFESPEKAPELSPEEKARIEKEAADAARGCAACGTGAIAAILVAIVLNIALMVWVARDAKARGMDSSILWMFLVMGTGLIGLIIYLLSRPQGPLAVCQTCGGKRLAVSAICPHCRNA